MSTTTLQGKQPFEVQLAVALILSEFDIDQGACVRSFYPNHSKVKVPLFFPGQNRVEKKVVNLNIQSQEEYFANVMLPDGAEKVEVAKSVFMCNRPKPQVYARFPCYRFVAPAQYASQPSASYASFPWERVSAEVNSPHTSEILLVNRKNGHVSIRYKDQVLLKPVVLELDNISVVSSLPPSVQAVASNINVPTVSSNSAGSPGSGVSGSSALPPFMFFVVRIGKDILGLLMQTTFFQNFVETLTVALEPPSPVHPPLQAFEQESAHVVAEEGTVDAAPGDNESHTEENKASYSEIESNGMNQNRSSHEEVTNAKEEIDTANENAAQDPESTNAAMVDLVEVPAENSKETDPTMVSNTPEGPLSITKREESGTTSVGGANLLPATSTTGIDKTESEDMSSRNARTPNPEYDVQNSQRLVVDDKDDDDDVPFDTTGQSGATEEEDAVPLFGLCAVVTKRDSLARRGGLTKSVAVVGPSMAWLEAFFPILVEAAYYCCDIPGTDVDAAKQQESVLKMCYESMNKASPLVAAALQKTSTLQSEVQRYSTLAGSQHLYVNYKDTPFGTFQKIRIPSFPTSHDFHFMNFGLENLVDCFGPQFIALIHGVITEKKIVILSKQGQATDVCEATLALGLIGNLLDPNFFAKKVFPYTSVNIAEHFINVPGYIVGTMNPIFGNQRTWKWDILCNLDEKTVTFGEEKKPSTRKSALTALSNAAGGLVGITEKSLVSDEGPFYKELVSAIYRMRALRIPQAERNRRIRLMIEEKVHTLILADYGRTIDPAILDCLNSSFLTPPMVELRLRIQVTSMTDNISTHILFPDEPVAMPLLCAALRRCAKATDLFSVQRLLQLLLQLLDKKDHILFFLRHMTVAVGGIEPVAFQLMSASPTVREVALQILKTLDTIPEGKTAISAMNNFLITIYDKLSPQN